MQTFGELLRELREGKGLGLREFARAVNVSAGFVSQLERGKAIALPSEETIRAMAARLGADPEFLLAEAGKVPKDVKNYLSEQKDAVTLLRTAKKRGLTGSQYRRLIGMIERGELD